MKWVLEALLMRELEPAGNRVFKRVRPRCELANRSALITSDLEGLLDDVLVDAIAPRGLGTRAHELNNPGSFGAIYESPLSVAEDHVGEDALHADRLKLE